MTVQKKMIMLRLVSAWATVMLSGVVISAHGEVLPGCSDQSLLSDVRNLIISSNKLSDQAVVQFSEVKTLRNVPAPYFQRSTQEAELACSALVGLVPEESSEGKAVELVVGLYGLTVKRPNGYQVYFQPTRSKK